MPPLDFFLMILNKNFFVIGSFIRWIKFTVPESRNQKGHSLMTSFKFGHFMTFPVQASGDRVVSVFKL